MISASTAEPRQPPFLEAFRGSFRGILQWEQLDRLWDAVRAQAQRGWYIYAIGEEPPRTPADPERLESFLREIDALLRREHEEDYCGIVYADNPEQPALVKIFDPNNLGVVCGYSDNPPLPGWVLSAQPPCELKARQPVTGARRRWWRRLLGGET
jgi:hypothetical protein